MKKIIYAFLVLICLGQSLNVIARAETLNVSLSEVDEIKKQVEIYTNFTLDEYLPNIDILDASTDTEQIEQKLSIKSITEKLLRTVLKEITSSLSSIVKIFVVAVLSAVLKIICDSFENAKTANIAQFTCQAVMISYVIINVRTVLDISHSTITNITDFMKATLPAFVSVMCASGATISSSLVSPALFFTSELIANTISQTILPLFALAIAFSGIDMLSDKPRLIKLAKLLKTICFWALGLIMTVFVGVTSVRGIVGYSADGVAGKAVKYAITTFVPIVGGYLADAADTILGGMMFVKNICGIGILIGMVGICLVPIIKIVAIGFAYKIAVAIISAFANEKVTAFVDDTAGTMFGIAGITLCVLVMFMFSIIMLMSVASNVAMMR